MSADERNDTIALLSLATYPYPGEKSKKHKKIHIMKRYLSLALALILALAVFCGVSVSADDTEVDVNRLPTCPHLIEETDVDYGMWLVSDGCKIMTRTVKRTYMCVICGFTYTESTDESKEGHHTWIPNEDEDMTEYRYKCAMCGAKR